MYIIYFHPWSLARGWKIHNCRIITQIMDINHDLHIPSNFVIIFIILLINSRSNCKYTLYMYMPCRHQRLVDDHWHWISFWWFKISSFFKIDNILNTHFITKLQFFFKTEMNSVCKQLFLLLVYFLNQFLAIKT